MTNSWLSYQLSIVLSVQDDLSIDIVDKILFDNIYSRHEHLLLFFGDAEVRKAIHQ